MKSFAVSPYRPGFIFIIFYHIDDALWNKNYSFAGEDHVSVLISGNYSGMPIYERMVLLKAGNYMGVVTAFSLDTEQLDNIMGFFSAFAG